LTEETYHCRKLVRLRQKDSWLPIFWARIRENGAYVFHLTNRDYYNCTIGSPT